MAELQQQLKDVGSELENVPATKDGGLIELLKRAEASLSELDQSPPKAVMDSMQPLLKAIVKPELVKYQDEEVKLLVATCICEITRVTAPEAPYSDDILKEVFHLIVSTFSGLRDTKSPSFGRRVVILETLARYRSCVVMLDLECDDLINEMFTTFFAVASNEHSESVLTSMQTIMVVLLEESEEVKEDLVLVILSALGREKKDMAAAARSLAMKVIGCCAEQLEAGIKQFLVSSMSGNSRPKGSQIDYHEIIYDIYHCAPQVLSGVVPYLTGELLTDKIDIRLKAVGLVGDLFALPESTISEPFQLIFLEFLKRLTDRVVEVRMSVLEHVKLCLLSDPFRAEAPQIISALCDRLLDYDESIRKQVVAVICDVACCALSAISVETVKLIAERLRDKSYLVKRYSMERLSEIYRTYCLKHSDGSIKSDEYDWIPGKILRCFYDKDFRSDTVEDILCTSLLPAQFSVKDRVANWIRLFSGFDRVEVKALQKILEHKQRLQLEMQKYLSLRQTYQENEAPELHKRFVLCFKNMSRYFIDPTKTEENFQILDQLKDVNIWNIFSTLLDPNTSSLQASSSRDDLLKILGEKHQIHGFLSTLTLKCSYILFNKDYVKDFLLEADLQKSAGNRQLTESCMNVLVILASFSPSLLSGTEDTLVHFLEDDDEVIKEGALHVLAKAGGTIREKLGESSSSLALILERICLEGSRRQAKYAVHALAAITKDDGLMSLSVLYKRLVDMLKEKTHLPAVLQSLGCIAQTAMPVFETRESEVEVFIKRNILECSVKTEDIAKESWDDRSDVCSLKIFGIKALVKSYLPVKDAHLRLGIDDLIRLLHKFLSFGEISNDIESSSVDKAHLRLASAKAVLRLSKHWEHKITVDIFYSTLRTLEVGFPEVKKIFLDKVHQYIKDRLLDSKYVCAFFLDLESQQSDSEEDKHNLSDIIQMCQQGKSRQLPLQANDPSSSGVYLENILPYLVHSLAHHSSCPDVDECNDVKAFEPIYRRLHLFLSLLAHVDEEGKGEVSLRKEDTISIASIFRSIKQSEDVVDTKKSKNSHGICDLGLWIIKRLAQTQDDLQAPITYVSLPPVLYKSPEQKEGNDTQATEGQTWLADESVLVHFESLKLETNVPSVIVEDEDLMDSETDGNEIPLGKMLKRLKAKGAKARKALKNGSLPTEDKNENNVDILDMVREINLDNMGVSGKLDSNNGHTHSPGENKTYQKKKRKGFSSVSTNVPVPKRPRSSSTQSSHKSSFPKSSPKGSRHSTAKNRLQEGVAAFDSIKVDEDLHNSGAKTSVQERLTESTESDLVVPSNRKKGRSSGWSRIQSEDFGDTEDDDLKKPKKERDADATLADDSSKMGSAKNRKRKNISGLSKCTAKEDKSHTTDLIGCRIKVWWPMDKAFYEGVVKSYDHQKQKHVVLYNDGDVEVLQLDKERWELIDNGRTPTKRLKSSKSPRSKGGSSKPKTKSLGGSKQTKKSTEISPSSKVTGKRTPRKSSKQGQEWASKWKSPELIEAERNETSESSDPEAPTFTKVNNLDTEEEPSDEEDKKLVGGNKSDKDDKLVSEGKQAEGDGGGLVGEDECDMDEKPVSEGKQAEDGASLVGEYVFNKDEKPVSKGKQAEDGGSLVGEDESDKDEKPVSEGKQAKDGGTLGGEDESDRDEKPVPDEKQMEDAENSSIDTDDVKEEPDSNNKQATDNVDNNSPNASGSDEEEKSQSKGNQSPNVSKENSTLIADEEDKTVPLQNETDDANSSSPVGPTTSDKKSPASDSGDAEFSDDEPLCAWKSRVGKSAEGK